MPWVVEQEHRRYADGSPADRDRLLTAQADVTDPAALSSVVETLRSRHGRVDILVTLVGGFAPGSLVETDRPTWERMLNLNLTSAFTAARTVRRTWWRPVGAAS